MKSVTLTCDCGCGITASDYHQQGWLVLSQVPYQSSTTRARINRDLHFATFTCLQKWTKNAMDEIPRLQKSGAGAHPRGTFVSEKAAGLIS
jgi:hypothetical protein